LWHNINMRRYLLPIIDFILNNQDLICGAIGIDATSKQWKDFVTSSVKYVKDPLFCAADHKGFDLHIGSLLMCIISSLYLVIANYIGYTSEDMFILSELLFLNQNIHLIVHNDVILLNNVNPSGSIDTTIRNTFANCFLCMYVSSVLVGIKLFGTFWGHHIYAMLYGDDMVLICSSEYAERFRFESIQELMKETGFDLQSVNKDEKSPHFTNLFDPSVSFLKRGFKKLYTNPNKKAILTAPLELTSINKMMLYYEKSDEQEFTIQNMILDQVQREAFLHGDKVFGVYSRFISMLKYKYGYTLEQHTFDFYDLQYRSGEFETWQLRDFLTNQSPLEELIVETN